MMLRILVFMVCVTAGAAFAREVLPPDVRALGRKVDAATRALGEARREVSAAQRRLDVVDTRLQRSTHVLVRVRQYPPGFWLARAVAADQPAAAGVLAMMVQQNAGEVDKQDRRVNEMRALYGEANAQVEALRGLQAAFSTARGRLAREEREALKAAALEADVLVARLEALRGGADAVPPPLADGPKGELKIARLPLQGRIVQGFHQGKGAMEEGVVMEAGKGADVVSVVSGEVLYSGPFRQFGGVVIVKAESGEDIVFGGLGSLNVVTGSRVLAGDTVGSVGNDGRLYWEVRRRGRTINPLALR